MPQFPFLLLICSANVFSEIVARLASAQVRKDSEPQASGVVAPGEMVKK